jgi:hypothetical protein
MRFGRSRDETPDDRQDSASEPLRAQDIAYAQ